MATCQAADMAPALALVPPRRARHDDLRRDVGAGRRAPARSTSGRGSPTTDGPAEVLEAADRGHPRRREPVPARAGHARAARARSPRTSARFYGIEVDPDTEVLVTAGATEAHRRRAARAVRPRRRGRRLRAELRQLRGVHRAWPARAPRPVTLRPPRTRRPTSTRCGALDHRPHAADPAQLAAQPDRQGVRPREELAAIAELVRRARPHRRHRRGVRAPRVRRASTSRSRRSRAWPSARSPSVGGQDVLFTGWKIGWVMRPAPSW